MRYLSFTLLALCLSLCTSVGAQSTLTGRIIDSLTKDPVAFATVYLDGTSVGEITGNDGTFSLKGVRPPATLVISHLAYRTMNLKIVRSGSLGDLVMRPQEAVISGVEVTDGNLRGKTLAEFFRLMIGTDEWAEKSAILNDEVLQFDRDYTVRTTAVSNDFMRNILKKRNRPSARWNEDETVYSYERSTNLKAKTRGVMKVRLPHLGYTLGMDLSTFLSEYKNGYTSYLGTFYFESDPEVNESHLRNRARAYYGSGMHFARALLSGTLEENGFMVVAVTEDGLKKQGAMPEVDLQKFLVEDENGINYLIGLEGRELAILYYADGRSRPVPRAKWKRKQPRQSRLRVRGNKCMILPGGVFGDTNMVFLGDIGSRKLAWALPADFEAPEDIND